MNTLPNNLYYYQLFTMKVQALDTYVRKGSYNDRGAYSLAICRLLNFPQPVVNLNHDHIP